MAFQIYLSASLSLSLSLSLLLSLFLSVCVSCISLGRGGRESPDVNAPVEFVCSHDQAAEGSMDASNMLKPALSRGELHCVGATTLAEYRKVCTCADCPLMAPLCVLMSVTALTSFPPPVVYRKGCCTGSSLSNGPGDRTHRGRHHQHFAWTCVLL